MRVRRAEAGDAEAIAAVHVRSWKAAFPGLIPKDYLDALRPEDRLPMWHEVLAATVWPRFGTFVAVGGDRGDVVGFANIGPSRDDDAGPAPRGYPGEVGEVYTIYLDPPVWGTGAGSALLDAAVAEMRAAGYRRATLWTLGTNDRARRFYERRGWRPDGTSKVHDWEAFTATDVRYGIVLD